MMGFAALSSIKTNVVLSPEDNALGLHATPGNYTGAFSIGGWRQARSIDAGADAILMLDPLMATGV